MIIVIIIIIILKETIYIKTIMQIDKHKAKIYNYCIYTQITIKKILLFIKKNYNYIKKVSSPQNHNFFFVC